MLSQQSKTMAGIDLYRIGSHRIASYGKGEIKIRMYVYISSYSFVSFVLVNAPLPFFFTFLLSFLLSSFFLFLFPLTHFPA